MCRGPKGLEKLVGLATKECVPCEKGSMQPMDESAAYTLRNQVSTLFGRAERGMLMYRTRHLSAQPHHVLLPMWSTITR